MPTRNVIFKNNRRYHIYDKMIDQHKIFADLRVWKVFLAAIRFYSYEIPNVSFSYFKRMNERSRFEFECEHMIQKNKRVDIICHVGIPNHYHFIMKQLQSDGIVRCMSDSLNSITRYYNRRHQRKGPIFLPQFRSVAVLSTRQLIYTSKYIHRNPLKHGLVKTFEELIDYPTSSLQAYTYLDIESWVKRNDVMKHFNNSSEEYLKYLASEKNLELDYWEGLFNSGG